MGNLKDAVARLGIDFKSEPKHIIDFDPLAETTTIRGQDGKDFEVIPVMENGQARTLSLSNKSLLRQLSTMTGKCRLEITRIGESYATTYNVKKVA